MRVYKTKGFVKFTEEEKIKDEWLIKALKKEEKKRESQNNKSHLSFPRVKREGKGTSGGYRTAVLLKLGDKAFFVDGYPRKEKDGFSEEEKRIYRGMAKKIFALDEAGLQTAINGGEFKEVKYDD